VVRGIAKVVGSAEVGAGELDGTVVVGGAFTADQLKAVGALEVRGPLTVAGRFSMHGSLDAGGSVHAGEAVLRGPSRLGGELVVDGTLAVHGTLQAPSVECGVLDLSGTAMIPGAVVATSVDADLVADSAIGTIQCRQLRLRGPVPNIVRRVLGRPPVVTVERVEAESARIEGARVRFVRAREIVLGRGAHVGAVEGKVARAPASSRVGPESWSRPPYGLSR
jgi:cytoskeletal protein CcmA (bactofilin family)